MTVAPGSMRPLLGLTQYRRGAVVLTLKHTLLSDGFLSFRLVVTTSVKGPTHTHTQQMFIRKRHTIKYEEFWECHFMTFPCKSGNKTTCLTKNYHV